LQYITLITAAMNYRTANEPKRDILTKSEEAPGLVFIPLISPVLRTYAPKPMKIYLTKFCITQTMFFTVSCRPSLIPHIITTLDHEHTTDHCPKD